MITNTTRRFRAEAYGEWVGLAYRGLLYGLASTPLWGAGLTFIVIWHRTYL